MVNPKSFIAVTARSVCFIIALVFFSGNTTCCAQSLLGKWKGVSVENYFSETYAKELGRSMEKKSSKEAGQSEIEYVADHTFVLTFAAPNSSEVTTMKGTWAVTGDQLAITMEPHYNPRKISTVATFMVTGNTMVTTVAISPPSRNS